MSALDSHRPRRTVPAIATVVAAGLTLLAVGGLVVWSAAPPKVEVTAEHLEIDSSMFSTTVARDDIVDVQLIDRLPPIELRTWGYADGRRLRGSFRVRDRGVGGIFVDAQAPPFVLVTTGERFVIVQGRTPADTRALADQLRR